MDAVYGVIVVVEPRDDEAEEAPDETDDLHPFAAIEFVVNQERSKVISNKLDSNVGEVPKPANNNVVRRLWANDRDELRLKELVAVEKHVIGVLC